MSDTPLQHNTHLDIVDVHFPFFPKLERAFAFIFPEGIGLIDLGILR